MVDIPFKTLPLHLFDGLNMDEVWMGASEESLICYPPVSSSTSYYDYNSDPITDGSALSFCNMVKKNHYCMVLSTPGRAIALCNIKNG